MFHFFKGGLAASAKSLICMEEYDSIELDSWNIPGRKARGLEVRWSWGGLWKAVAGPVQQLLVADPGVDITNIVAH